MEATECPTCQYVSSNDTCPYCLYTRIQDSGAKGLNTAKRRKDRAVGIRAAIGAIKGLGAMLLLTSLGCGVVKTNDSISDDYATEIVYQYELNHVLTYSDRVALRDIAKRQILTAIEERESNGL